MIRAPSNCARGCVRIEGKAGDRKAAAFGQRLADCTGKIAFEGGRGQQAGLRIKQALGLDGAQAAAQLRFQRMLADQRQRVGGDMRGLAGDDFEIGQFVGWREFVRGQHDRQVAEARIFRQHRQERIDHAGGKAFRDHDAVDVAIGEVLGGGLDAEGADHTRAFAERDRQRRESSRRAQSTARSHAARDRSRSAWLRPAARRPGGAARSHSTHGPAAPRAGAGSGDRSCRRSAPVEGHCREARPRARPRSGEGKACAGRSAAPAPAKRAWSTPVMSATTAAGCMSEAARTALLQSASMTGNSPASSSAAAKDGLPLLSR